MSRSIHISVRAKLILMLLPPILGLAYFSVSQVMSSYNLYWEHDKIQSLSQSSVQAATLVHELQKERGLTADFIDSQGKEFATQLSVQLSVQRKLVDAEIEQWDLRVKLNSTQDYGSEFAAGLAKSNRQLMKLVPTRAKISNLSINAKDAFDYFSTLNLNLLNLSEALPKISSESSMGNRAAAYTSFLYSMERAYIESALMAGVFVEDNFSTVNYQKFFGLVAMQSTYMNVFQSIATPEALAFYRNTLAGEYIAETKKMRNIAINSAKKNSIGVDSAHWVKMQAGKIKLLKNVDDWLAADLLRFSAESTEAARSSLITVSVIALIVFMLSVLFSYHVQNYMVKYLDYVNDIATSIAAASAR